MLLTTFTPNPPYNFDLLLQVSARYHPALDAVDSGAYYRALRVGERIALVQITSRGTLMQPSLDVKLIGGNVREADHPALIATLHHMLNIDGDRHSFYQFAQSDEVLRAIVTPLYGLPSTRMATVFEALLTTVVEQQISLAAAVKATHFLVDWGGAVIMHEHLRCGLLPTPERLAQATQADLTPTKITFRRIQVLINVAAQIANGSLDLEALRSCDPQTAYNALISINGIGHWTAAWTLIKGIGHHGYVFENDVALQAAVGHYFYGLSGREARLSPQRTADTFARYGAFAGEAAYYTITRWLLERY